MIFFNISVPSAPFLNVTNITYSQFIFVWEPPSYLAGNLHEFELVFEGEICFYMPDWCKPVTLKTIKHFNGSTFIFEYLNATAFTYYTAKIKARTSAGWGSYNNDLVLFKTPAGGNFLLHEIIDIYNFNIIKLYYITIVIIY